MNEPTNEPKVIVDLQFLSAAEDSDPWPAPHGDAERSRPAPTKSPGFSPGDTSGTAEDQSEDQATEEPATEEPATEEPAGEQDSTSFAAVHQVPAPHQNSTRGRRSAELPGLEQLKATSEKIGSWARQLIRRQIDSPARSAAQAQPTVVQPDEEAETRPTVQEDDYQVEITSDRASQGAPEEQSHVKAINAPRPSQRPLVITGLGGAPSAADLADWHEARSMAQGRQLGRRPEEEEQALFNALQILLGHAREVRRGSVDGQERIVFEIERDVLEEQRLTCQAVATEELYFGLLLTQRARLEQRHRQRRDQALGER